jgi:glutamate/tyrosine decarboxylase-like PLP-dependent enzyme
MGRQVVISLGGRHKNRWLEYNPPGDEAEERRLHDVEPLTLSSDEMRAMGYRVVDMIVAHLESLRDKPFTRRADRAALEALLWVPPPAEGSDGLQVLEELDRDILSAMMNPDHPRYFAFIPGPGNYVSALADALASGMNIFAGTWLEGSAPAEIELVTIDWLRAACGLPETAGGLYVSGGSVANLTALAVARQVTLGGQTEGAIVYGSDQTHSSIGRGLRTLGFGPDQLRVIPGDDRYRFDVPALRSAIEEDIKAGLIPLCVVGTAGTTNTGSVDPLDELADLCKEQSLWFHVDGAYGAAAALSPRGRTLMPGLERADTLVLDPHKWLFQPFDMGCLIARQSEWLEETFSTTPEYLRDTQVKTGEVNFWERGIQLTRSFRALKLWLSIKVFGWSAFQRAIERGFELAELTEATVRARPGWEVATPAQLSIITFRCAPPGMSETEVDQLNRDLVSDMIADGTAMISSTVLRGRTVLRMCTMNPRATDEDIELTIGRLAELADQRLRRGR